MDIEEYQSKDIAGKILYLASLFKGIKDHLDVLNEREELNHKTDKQENSMRAGSTVWRMVRGTAPAGKRMDCETGAGLLQ